VPHHIQIPLLQEQPSEVKDDTTSEEGKDENTSEEHGEDNDTNNENFQREYYGHYKAIEKWCSDPANMKHPFYIQWKKAKFKGLHFNSPQTKIFDILQIPSYEAYKQYMVNCPITLQTESLDDEQYKQTSQDTYTNIQKIFKTIQDTEYNFEHKLFKITKQIENFTDAMTNKQNNFENHLTNTTEKETKLYQQNVQNIYTTVFEEAKQQLTRLKGDVKTHVENSIDTFCTRISNLVQTGVNSMETTIKQYDIKMTARAQCLTL
jgi:hypothetical protein